MTYIEIDHYGWTMCFDFEWSGSSVSGRGPDDEVPDIGDVKGWLENSRGEFIRDFLPKELNQLWNGGEGPVADAVYERIHEICQEPYDEPEYP